MRFLEFAPSPERDNDEMPNQLLILANRWWNATDEQPQIEHVLNSLGWSIHQVESEDDAVQLQHRDGTTHFISADEFDPDLFEISDELRRNYLHRADQHVSRRMDHMARVRDRLNKGYEIYHADRPAGSNQIVDRFDADTPALARQYYERFIQKYESDVDFDLRLRRSTGIMEDAGQDYLWHGSTQEIPILTPRQAKDTGGAAGSNQNAIYATSDPKVAIAMGLTERGADTGMFPNDPQMVLFSGKIRRGQNVYLHKLPFNGPDGKPQFVQGGNTREFHSVPGVQSIKPIEIKAVPVDKYLNLIRTATPQDLELRKKYVAKQPVNENQSVSTADMINYIRKHHDNNLHSDYTNYITNNFTGFELRNIPVNTIKTDLPKLDSAKVEQYKTMDFSKAPPIVVGDGNILDGYHRANVAKALGIPTIQAYVGIKRVNEITKVPTVVKSKQQHLDVMPNEGRPIPRGDETEYLGDLVAEMGDGFQLWSWRSHGTVTYYVYDTETRRCQLGTTGRPYSTNRDSFVIHGVYSGPRNRYRAADLYAFLVLNRGLTLVSDYKQSAGGYRVWQELQRRYGRRINIHGFDTRTNEPVNVSADPEDEPDTHVDRDVVKRAGPAMKKELGSISRDLRFVASAR